MGSSDGTKYWHTHYSEVEVDCVHVGSRDGAVVRALGLDNLQASEPCEADV